MPVQLLQPQRTVGQAFGTGLESGIGNALNILTQTKLNDIMQQKQRPGLIRGLISSGYTPKEAEGLADLPPDLLGIALKQKTKSAALAPFMDIFQQAYGQPQFTQQAQEQQPESLQQAQPNEMQRILKGLMPNSSGPQDLQQLFPNQEDMVAQTMMRGLQKQQQTMPAAEPTGQRQQAITPAQIMQNAEQSQRPPPSKSELAQMAASFATGDPKEIVKTMRSIEKERAAASRFERKEGMESYKITKEGREKILEEGRGARQNLQDLERMDELNKSGKLDTPGYVEFLKNTGLDMPALMNPESEEFQKVAQTFMRDARKYFGGRVSNYEVEQFLKTIPSLSQSPEGRNRVIANLRRYNKAAVSYSRELKDLVKKNRGAIPLDYQEQLDDIIEPKIDKFAAEFREDLKKEVPKGQNKMITAMQAVAGGVLGAPGKIISKLAGAADKILG